MQPVSTGSPSVRTRTEHGIRWLVFSIAISLATGVLGIAIILGAPQDLRLSLWVFTALEVIGGVVVILGLIGFWMLRLGRAERGPAHASSMRRSTIALVAAGASESLIFATGILLGYGVVPSGLIISTLYPIQVTPQWVLKTLHFGGYVLLAASVGLTLLWVMWQMAPGVPRWVALAALVVGTGSPLITFLDVTGLALPGSFPVALFYASWFLPFISGSLWLVTYILVMIRIRGDGPRASSDVPAD